MHAVMSRSHRVHNLIATVQVTAPGMFADGGGFAIALPTIASLTVAVGGISPGPVEVDGHIETIELLDLTVSIDHNVVDGAPATRSAAELRHILQRAIVFPRSASRLRDESGPRSLPAEVVRLCPTSSSWDVLTSWMSPTAPIPPGWMDTSIPT